MTALRFLAFVVMLLMLARFTGATNIYLRYDQNNFEDITASSGFQVTPYSSIDPSYKVDVPPGGRDSGGAFIFDLHDYTCTKNIVVNLQKNLIIRFSYWCDPTESELYIKTKCNYYSQTNLCGKEHPERYGKWNQTVWLQNCSPMDGVLGESGRRREGPTSKHLTSSSRSPASSTTTLPWLPRVSTVNRGMREVSQNLQQEIEDFRVRQPAPRHDEVFYSHHGHVQTLYRTQGNSTMTPLHVGWAVEEDVHGVRANSSYVDNSRGNSSYVDNSRGNSSYVDNSRGNSRYVDNSRGNSKYVDRSRPDNSYVDNARSIPINRTQNPHRSRAYTDWQQ
ncbi:hypothetical protein Hamer_G021556 [Homarus americanus]|uniref:Uncharacterized protein n=1 Tax=Homarus americanus TaxID=6706 RepID=A0A8J5JAL9_HOMAM|nr:hypothetical protein Hamer_G021556 [Homarus americanus]